jgi:hypothetical protein
MDVVVTSVLYLDGGWIVVLAGGHGRWWSDQDEAMVNITEATRVELVFGWASVSDAARDAYQERLTSWADAATPLRLGLRRVGRAVLALPPPRAGLMPPSWTIDVVSARGGGGSSPMAQIPPLEAAVRPVGRRRTAFGPDTAGWPERAAAGALRQLVGGGRASAI